MCPKLQDFKTAPLLTYMSPRLQASTIEYNVIWYAGKVLIQNGRLAMLIGHAYLQLSLSTIGITIFIMSKLAFF